MADVFAYAQVEGIELRLDATRSRLAGPPAGRSGARVRFREEETEHDEGHRRR